MFNDDVQMGFFDVYDQYLVNILYDPRIRAGMTKAEVEALFPQIFPTVRAFVARSNVARGDDPDERSSDIRSASGLAAAVVSERAGPQRRH